MVQNDIISIAKANSKFNPNNPKTITALNKIFS
jgi:hypothetical protein